MPFYLRRVQPMMVGRMHSTSSTMEETANNTLCNLVRQLGSIGRFAIDIFEGIEEECKLLGDRCRNVSQRIDALNDSLLSSTDTESTWSPDLTEPKLNEDDERFHAVWGSETKLESCFFTKESRPEALNKLYEQCEQVPELSAVQHLRDDDKNCMKMYSDPSMFFECWRQAMLAAAAEQKQLRRRRKKCTKQGPQRNQVKVAKIVTFADKIREREERAGNITLSRKKSVYVKPSLDKNVDNTADNKNDAQQDNEDNEVMVDTEGTKETNWELEDDLELLPPPPDELLFDPDIIDNNENNVVDIEVEGLPPPPPPPPPPTTTTTTSMTAATTAAAATSTTKMVEKKSKDVGADGDRSDLLRQIREGKALRKVQRRSSSGKKSFAQDNVASILALVMEQRFAAMHDNVEEEDEEIWEQYADQ